MAGGAQASWAGVQDATGPQLGRALQVCMVNLNVMMGSMLRRQLALSCICANCTSALHNGRVAMPGYLLQDAQRLHQALGAALGCKLHQRTALWLYTIARLAEMASLSCRLIILIQVHHAHLQCPAS